MNLYERVPKAELDCRLARLRTALTAQDASWRMILITHKVNLYYLTGTMQEGVLAITPAQATLWVRRSYSRAKEESLFDDIRPMRSFRTLAEHYETPQTVYLETKYATLEWLGMIQRHLAFSAYKSIIPILSALRAQKSEYEIARMRNAGKIHEEVLCKVAPALLHEGISEAELAGELYTALLSRGSMGIARFNQPMGEDVAGLVSFSESSLFETAFDGPGGTAGTCLALQCIGSSTRKLRRGDIIYLDIPAGKDGYHTDKTVTYYLGDLDADPRGALVRSAYDCCVSIIRTTAQNMVPGAIPAELYANALAMVPPQFSEGFMNECRFLGHSIGLVMDETPVLAQGFTEPLCAGMTLAVEPKIALPGIGVVGLECTYLICANGPAEALNGDPQPLRMID